MAGMRSMWVGSVSFGLVTIPVKMYKSTDSHDIAFHQMHGADGGKIKYVKTCAECNEVVDPADIVKATKVGDQNVVVTEDELKSLVEEQPKVIEVLAFVDESEIDPLAFESSYYLGPNGLINGYHLLRAAMEDTGRVAIARVTPRSRTSLALLRISNGNVLTLHMLSWPDEIRTPQFPDLDKPHVVKEQELAVAKMLVDSMTGSFKPQEFVDVYHDRLVELLEAKSAGEAFTPVKAAPVTEDVTDLMAMLEASVAKHPAGKGTAKRAPAKAPAKKAPAKKARVA